MLIADATQNAMANEYRSLTDGLVLALTLIFWNWILDYGAMRWGRFRRIIRPAPIVLIRDGWPVWHNTNRELLTKEEMLGYLRLQGVERIEDVKYAFMETDGRTSVIPNREEDKSQGESQDKKAV